MQFPFVLIFSLLILHIQTILDLFRHVSPSQHLRSMASTLESNDPIKASFFDHFSCKICLEILKKPVQCQRNEHYFCTSCITQHLRRNQTCPLCMEELTLETLRPIPRVVADLLSQYDVPLCKNVQRGCKEVVEHQDLPFHHEVCAFAPVSCPIEGCDETVNKQDLASHEKESCKFRKIKCEDCDKEMTYRDHVKHSCVVRKEMDEMKMMLREIGSCLKEIQDEVKGHGEAIKNLQDPLRLASSCLIRQERMVIVNGQIVVAGGDAKSTMRSYEVFNWSTKTWTLFKNALFFDHYNSLSFLHNNNIMICGGQRSERVECLDMTSFEVFSWPATVPKFGKAALCGGDQIITFEKSVVITFVKPPYLSETVLAYGNDEERSEYGLEYVNEKVVVVGGLYRRPSGLTRYKSSQTDNVVLFNPATNELKKLAPLPYKVSRMATVPYKDHVIIIGGQGENHQALNNVLLYNITSQECRKLPSMLESRFSCTAVIMGDVIVVMGGFNGKAYLNTVEFHVLGQDTWNKLPPMHCGRAGLTACVKA